jgi:hypothetical protein
VQCNVFYHNGWKHPVTQPADPANNDEKNAMMFRHGWYENPGNSNAVAGIDKFNFYLRNASYGHQGRVGNHKMLWNVYWDNGNGCDAFCGAGWKSNLPGEIGNFAVFGNLAPDFYCWGGGINGISTADYIHDGLFAGPATSMQIDAAITIQWTGGNGPAQVPLPANTTALLENLRGWWNVNPAVLTLQGRTCTQTNVNIRRPGPNDAVPTLGQYFGFTGTPAEIEAQVAAKLQNPEPQQAQKVIAWLGAQLPQ